MGSMFFNGKRIGNVLMDEFLQQEQADYRESDSTEPGYIKNKPIIETPEDNSKGLQMVDKWEPNDNDGDFSTILGSASKIDAGANYSLAGGFGHYITGAANQTALGLQHILFGDTLAAIGRRITMGGLASIGIGETIHADGKNIVAAGYGLAGTNDKQVLLGRVNAPNESAVLIVGNGREERQNAMTVQEDGSVTIGGHHEADQIRPALRGVDRFSDCSAGDSIGIVGNVVISVDGLKYGGKRTATFNGNGQELPWLCPQTNVNKCYVSAGDTYSMSMKVYSYGGNKAATVHFWLAAMSEGAEDEKFAGSEEYIDRVVCNVECPNFINDKWNDVSVEFTAKQSGLIRIGISKCPEGNRYAVGAVVISNKTPSMPVYNYCSVRDKRQEKLYRVDDVPCDTGYIREWLVGRTLVTEYGDITVTEDMVSNNLEGWHDAGYNYIVKYTTGQTTVILMCIVDTIDHREMDVMRLGMYVSERVIEIPCKRWVDNPADVSAETPAAEPDDTSISGEHTWSSKNILDKLCLPINETGSIVSCYPVEGYPLDVNYGENYITIQPGVGITVGGGTFGSLTIKGHEGGRLTVDGTYTQSYTYNLLRGLPEGVQEGDTLRLTGCPPGGGDDYRLRVCDGWAYDTGAGVDFVVEADMMADFKVDLFINSGVTCDNLTFYPRLSKAENTPTSVTRYGKNLLPFPYHDKGGTFNNYTYTVNADGSITASGTMTGQYNFMFAQGYTVYKGVKYTLSVDKNTTKDGGWLYVYSASQGKVLAQIGMSYQSAVYFTPTETITDANIYFVCQPSDYFLGTVKVQLEIGNSVTPYEPCIPGQSFPMGYDGATIPALPGCNTLLADKGTINVKGAEDTHHTIEQLTAAIISLGGNM